MKEAEVKNVLVNTMTSFVGTPASNETRSSGIDESFEPRAEETPCQGLLSNPLLQCHQKKDMFMQIA